MATTIPRFESDFHSGSAAVSEGERELLFSTKFLHSVIRCTKIGCR